MAERNYVKIGFYLVVVISVIGIIIAIARSALGKALSAILGTFAGVLTAVGAQIGTCNKVGYFNPGKGCYIGVLGIGYVVLQIIFLVGRWLQFRTADKSTNDTSTLKGESAFETARGIVEKIDADAGGDDVTEEVRVAAIKKAFHSEAYKETLKAIKEQSFTPEKAQAENAEALEMFQENIRNINDDLDSQQQEESDSLAEEMTGAEIA